MGAWTVVGAIVSGFTVFVLGQIAVRLWIDPVNELLKTIAGIAHTRVEHAQAIQTPGVMLPERYSEAAARLRVLSAQLHSHVFLIRPYRFIARFFHLPPRENLLDASKWLIGVANGVGSTSDRSIQSNVVKFENVCDALGIFIPADERWPRD